MNEGGAGRSAIRDPRTWMVAGVVVVVVAVLAAGLILRSGGDESPPDTLRVALATFGAEVLDPSADSQAGRQYYGHMFDYLIGATPEGRPSAEFGAIESWTVSPDARSYTLKLRAGMRWHNGEEITADDVMFSLEHYERAAVACAECGSLDEAIREMTLVDRYQLKVELEAPDIAFIDRLGPAQEDVPLLPGSYWEAVGEAGFAENPIGSGPWKFAGRLSGEFIEYEANLDYWDTDRVPAFPRLRLVQVADRRNRLALLKSGIVDMAPLDSSDVAALKADGLLVGGPKYVLETALRFFMSYDDSFLTADERFRKALILGMDLPSIVERIYPPEAATLASGSTMFTPVTQGFDPSLPPYPYDPEQSRELLRELGYSGETVSLLSISVYDQTETPTLNVLLAENWEKIGLNVEIAPTSYLPVKRRFLLRPQEFDDLLPAPAFHGGHVNTPGGIMNAIYRYLTSSSESLLTYHDPEKGDRIYADLLSIQDVGERQQRLRELNRELYEEYWSAPVVWRHDIWGVRPGLSDWQPTNGMTSHLNFETVRPAD